MSLITGGASLAATSQLLWLSAMPSVALGDARAASPPLATGRAASKGRVHASVAPRIIGGVKAGDDRYPYSVSLQDAVGHFCGGSLVARDAVLTAAHCVWDDAPFRVRVGSDAVDEGALLDVEQVAVHPRNDPDTDRHDLSLVFTRDLASPDLALVRINDMDAVPAAGERAVAMGWGDTETTADPVDLHEVRLEVIANRECAAASDGSLSYAGWIYDDMLCTFTPNRDACQGDSGGPLVMPGHRPEDDVQVGVVSWGVGCAHLPGVHSRISRAHEWIVETVCDNSRDPPESFACGTAAPTRKPSHADPSSAPSTVPTQGAASASPSDVPSAAPSTAAPTASPSRSPSASPSSTGAPSASPSSTGAPSASPSESPSRHPSVPTGPTRLRPTSNHTSASPSDSPSASPSVPPTGLLSAPPSAPPTMPPTAPPTASPTAPPTTPPAPCPGGKTAKKGGRSKCAKTKASKPTSAPTKARPHNGGLFRKSNKVHRNKVHSSKVHSNKVHSNKVPPGNPFDQHV